MIVYCTSSIQNVDCIWRVCAFCPGPSGLVIAPGSPSRNAMLSVPPPNSGAGGEVATVISVVETISSLLLWLRSTVFGSSKIACVIVPALMNGVRS